MIKKKIKLHKLVLPASSATIAGARRLRLRNYNKRRNFSLFLCAAIPYIYTHTYISKLHCPSQWCVCVWFVFESAAITADDMNKLKIWKHEKCVPVYKKWDLMMISFHHFISSLANRRCVTHVLLLSELWTYIKGHKSMQQATRMQSTWSTPPITTVVQLGNVYVYVYIWSATERKFLALFRFDFIQYI